MKTAIKTGFFIASFLVLSNATLAQSQNLKFCSDIEKAATSTMKMRQVGIPLGEAIELARKGEDTNKAASAYLVDLTIRAYKTHKFASPDNQQNAITEFANKEMLNCLQSKK
jgi:hypothetical protein